MTPTKKILIIDDRGKEQHPVLDVSGDIIEFFERVTTLELLDPKNYITVFVHQRNTKEVSWAKKQFNPVFIIDGGLPYPSKVDERLFFLPRTDYRKWMVDFVNEYLKSGKLNPIIFFPPGKGK